MEECIENAGGENAIVRSAKILGELEHGEVQEVHERANPRMVEVNPDFILSRNLKFVGARCRAICPHFLLRLGHIRGSI